MQDEDERKQGVSALLFSVASSARRTERSRSRTGWCRGVRSWKGSGLGDVDLGPNEGFPADHDDPLVVGSCSVRGKLAIQPVGGICPDDGEVAVVEFKDVRAGLGGGTAPFTGRRTDAAHDLQRGSRSSGQLGFRVGTG